MDEDEFFDVTYAEPMSRKFRKTDLAVLALDLLRGFAAAINSTLEMAEMLAGSHANHCIDRDEFHEQAAREIETLTNGEEHG